MSINRSHLEEAERIANTIDGMITTEEGRYLYHLASKSEAPIVEIGSWKGKSTVWLAKGSEIGNKQKIFAIDPHKETPDRYGEEETESIFKENIKKARVDHLVIPLVMKSKEAIKGWKGPISLLWIDGSHEYEEVAKDFCLWEPRLKLNGVIAFHDWTVSGPRKVIKNYILKSKRFADIHFVKHIFSTRKTGKCSFRTKCLKYALLILVFLPSDVSSLLPFAPIRRELGHIIIRILAKLGF